MGAEDTDTPTKLVGGGLLVAVSLGVIQVLAYAQTLVAARTLPPSEFGAFSALLALILIGNTVALAMQAVAARHIVNTEPGRRRDEAASAWRVSLQAGAITTAIALLLAPFITIGLRLPSPWIAVMLALIFLPLTAMGAALGIAQGEEQHGRLALTYLITGGPKALLTIALLVTVGGLAAGFFGLTVGAAASAVLCWLLVRGQWRGGHERHNHLLREIPSAMYAMLALFMLTNIDIVLGRAFLTADQAGEYGVGIIIAKVVTWLPQFVVVMAYARMADQRRGRTTVIGLGIVTTIGLLCTAAVAAMSGFVVSVVAGPEYADMADLLPLFALIGACGAVLQFVVLGLVAIRDRLMVPVMWVGTFALVAAVAVWHDSVGQVATLMLAVVGSVAAIGVWRLIAARDAPVADDLVSR